MWFGSKIKKYGTKLCTKLKTEEGKKPLSLFTMNDPSAGSPTETLLRLLLPLSAKVYKT